eukprot:g12342.t1
MYNVFKQHIKKDLGYGGRMEIGQSSKTGRYPSTTFQVRSLIQHVEVKGRVLDCCGATHDAVYTVLTAGGLRVTNDLDPRLSADTHMDASTDDFADFYADDSHRPEWIVSSPPYQHAFAILKQALCFGRQK